MLSLPVNPDNPYTSPTGSVLAVAPHGVAAREHIRFIMGAVLWGILIALLAAAPQFGRMFADFALELSILTQLYIAWWWILLPLATVTATIALVAPIVHRIAFQSHSLGLLWFIGLIVVPLLAIAVTAFALLYPLLSLITGLS